MNDMASAEIIAFPARMRAPELGPSTERLAIALSSLSVALKEQSEALHRWRDALRLMSERINEIGHQDRSGPR